MSAQIAIYRLNEFLRLNESGLIDVEASKLLIHKLALSASINSISNILVDLRETTICEGLNFEDVLDVAVEFASYLPAPKMKIASIIPDEEYRISIAKQIRDAIRLHGSIYEIFTTFEDAIDWLAGIESSGGSCRSATPT